MNPIKGTVAVIGNYGTGKTTFALECGYHPKDIVFINDDVKDVPFEKDFKKYVDLVAETKGLKILELHQHCLNLIDSLPESKVIIWDTWTNFGSTFFHYVKANEKEFRNPKEWAGKPSMKAGEWHNEAWRYEGGQLTKLRNKCDLLIVTFHTKQHYENNVAIPGKYKPGHDRAITKYSDLRIWLIQNPDSTVPSGLVLKNVGKYTLGKDGIETVQMLPQKLFECNWKTIRQYYDNPIGSRQPEAHELADAFELSLISGSLTAEEKRLYEASIKFVESQNRDEEIEQLANMKEHDKALKTRVQELNGKPLPLILKQIKEEIETGSLVYDGEVTMGQIANMTKG